MRPVVESVLAWTTSPWVFMTNMPWKTTAQQCSFAAGALLGTGMHCQRLAPSLFSLNSNGMCGHCQGLAVIYIDLAHMDEVNRPCDSRTTIRIINMGPEGGTRGGRVMCAGT